ncbi:MAG: GntR family transcriptional regulator [Rhodospirillales bacterium]|nr:GntR family transcriptional regulator [Rhodospirillales bacterium]
MDFITSPPDPPITPPADDVPVIEIIHHYFNRPGIELLTKHSRLQRAIVDGIAECHLRVGDRIPPELDLAKFLGVSLGTAQRALGGLARQGLLNRLQGKGTFIAENRIPEDELWHFRFLRQPTDKQYLLALAKMLEARLVEEEGPWTVGLGKDPKGYVMISRAIADDHQQMCVSRIYLPATRFSSLVDGTLGDPDLTNIKLILRRNFSVTNTYVEQTIQFAKIGKEDAKTLHCEAGVLGIMLTVYGYEADGTAISYHEILMPPSNLILDLSYSGAPVKLGAFAKGIGKV